MPVIAKEFNALSTISWVILSFMLMQTCVMPLAGRLADLLGRRNCLLASVGFFGVGSIACALSDSIVALVIFRAVQGIGGGGIMSCVMIVVSDLTPPASRAAYIAPLASMFALSSVVGPLLGGYLTDGPGWRFAFWINVPVCVPCFVIQFLFIPRSLGQEHHQHQLEVAAKHAAAAAGAAGAAELEDKKASAEFVVPNPMAAAAPPTTTTTAAKQAAKQAAAAAAAPVVAIDYWGSLCIIIGIICLSLALVWGGAEYPWSSPTIIVLLIIACLFILAFIYVEAYVAIDPIMPMRLFKVRNMAVSSTIVFFSGAAMACMYVYLPIFFEVTLFQTASEAGASMIPMMFGLPLGAILTGILVTKTGHYRLYPVLGCIALLIASYLFTTMRADISLANRVGFLLLGGMAMGPNVQVPLLAAQNAVPSRDVAVTSSAINFFQSVSGLIATAIAQTILNNRLKALMEPIVDDLKALFPNMPMTGDFDVRSLKGPLPVFYDRIIAAYGESTTSVFNIGIACAAIALCASAFMVHIPLRDGMGEGVHMEGVPYVPTNDADEKAALEAAGEIEPAAKAAAAAKAEVDAVAVPVAAAPATGSLAAAAEENPTV
jgi:MFS family permease